MLSLEAAQLTFDWLKVPRSWRARAWNGVRLLHDLQRHGQRFGSLYPLLCFHADAPLRLLDSRRDRHGPSGAPLPNCPRCATRWRCSVCEQPFVVHDPC